MYLYQGLKLCILRRTLFSTKNKVLVCNIIFFVIATKIVIYVEYKYRKICLYEILKNVFFSNTKIYIGIQKVRVGSFIIAEYFAEYKNVFKI